MDNNSRSSFMFGELLALNTVYRISAGRIDELKSFKAQDLLLVQIESNFNFEKRAIKLARSPCYIVQSCELDVNTFLCFYRARQDNACEVNEESNLHAASVLKARSFLQRASVHLFFILKHCSKLKLRFSKTYIFKESLKAMMKTVFILRCHSPVDVKPTFNEPPLN